jgi:hypothetical protein
MNQVEIHVKGMIDEQRSDWFEGLSVIHEGTNETVLYGQVVDQTALFGLLTKVRDLGLALVSVQVAQTMDNDARSK